MRLPGATRANDCSMLCLCYCGNPNLPPNPSGASCKNSCTRQRQTGLDGLPPTRTSGQPMVEALTLRSEELASPPCYALNFPRFMAPNDLLWPIPPAKPALNATDVHIWAAHLDLRVEALVRLDAILS